MTSAQEILDHEERGAWRTLLTTSYDFVAHAESIAGFKMNPVLGGGTRLMLELHHRLSDDIDLFIRDPQWIGYLTPRLNDLTESRANAYEENAVSLKLKMEQGEIDFIVAMSLLQLPNESHPNVKFELEPIAEVLAKKLFYRGSLLTPRDLFDWWAIHSTSQEVNLPYEQLAVLLKDRVAGIRGALDMMEGSRAAAGIWDQLRAPVKPRLREALDFARHEIEHYALIATQAASPSP